MPHGKEWEVRSQSRSPHDNNADDSWWGQLKLRSLQVLGLVRLPYRRRKSPLEEVVDGRIYGRGTQDMKSVCAGTLRVH